MSKTCLGCFAEIKVKVRLSDRAKSLAYIFATLSNQINSGLGTSTEEFGNEAGNLTP